MRWRAWELPNNWSALIAGLWVGLTVPIVGDAHLEAYFGIVDSQTRLLVVSIAFFLPILIGVARPGANPFLARDGSAASRTIGRAFIFMFGVFIGAIPSTYLMHALHYIP